MHAWQNLGERHQLQKFYAPPKKKSAKVVRLRWTHLVDVEDHPEDVAEAKHDDDVDEHLGHALVSLLPVRHLFVVLKGGGWKGHTRVSIRLVASSQTIFEVGTPSCRNIKYCCFSFECPDLVLSTLPT